VKTHALYPLQFHPVYRTAPWGGDAIARHYNRAGTPRHCAESWELSALPGTESIVQNGAFEGIALSTLAQTFGWELTGHKAPEPEVFPLLIKILDAHDALSVQVHPDAEASRARGVRPKREMWYVLEAEPGAKVWAGVEPGADFDALVEHLHAWEVTAGDVLDLPPGIVHAVGAGNLIYEVQQASDASPRRVNARGETWFRDSRRRSSRLRPCTRRARARSTPPSRASWCSPAPPGRCPSGTRVRTR